MTSDEINPPRSRSRNPGLLVLVLIPVLYFGIPWLARMYYAHELTVRERTVNNVIVTRSGNNAGMHVLLLGDSRVAEWPPLPADSFLTINAGMRGEITSQILARTEELLLTEKPAVVVVQGGINDVKTIGVLPERAAEIRNHCLHNLQGIVDLCRKHNVRVILTLILPVGKVTLARRLVWSDQVDVAMWGVNDALSREFITAEDVKVIDLGDALATTTAKRLEYYRDTLHLKPEAYEKLNQALLPVLARFAAAKRDHAPRALKD